MNDKEKKKTLAIFDISLSAKESSHSNTTLRQKKYSIIVLSFKTHPLIVMRYRFICRLPFYVTKNTQAQVIIFTSECIII